VELTEDIARNFARIALGHVTRPYPYKDDHVFESDQDVRAPRMAHPVFFGSFDWHSCVHGWWTLLTLRRQYPGMLEAGPIKALADETFTDAKLAIELAYLDGPMSRGFERPYGWSWLLYLHLEAERHHDREWSVRLEPLAQAFAARLCDYLRMLTYPITVGTHFNTAFALILARRWAFGRNEALVALIDEWAERAFGNRTDYRGWEPGGDEFLSPVLTAALLLTEIRSKLNFAPWFHALVIANGWLERECRPVFVSDRTDGKTAHLDGLNLSRAWCLRGIAEVLDDPGTREMLKHLADEHLEAALPYIAGNYMGEHWLTSFAVLVLLAPEQI